MPVGTATGKFGAKTLEVCPQNTVCKNSETALRTITATTIQMLSLRK